MALLTEAYAEKFGREQAGELARVIDLHARWENLRQDRPAGSGGYTTIDLQGRQRAYDTYHTRRAAYVARYGAADVPEANVNTPARVSAWCRLILAVCRRADPANEAPVNVVEKATRLAERLAVRLARPAPQASTPGSMGEAVTVLEAVAAWCDSFATEVQPQQRAA